MAENLAGVLISGLGALQRSGGGQAAWRSAQSIAVAQGAQFAVLHPLDTAARRWWARCGFKPVADVSRLQRHGRHNCEVFKVARQRLGLKLSEEAKVHGADVDIEDLIAALRQSGSGFTPPLMLWL